MGYVEFEAVKDNISDSVWPKCQDFLQGELPQQQFNTWIRPLSASFSHENSILLSAPNRFIEDWVRNHFLQRIREVVKDICAAEINIELKVKSQTPTFINNSIRVEDNDSSITTSDSSLMIIRLIWFQHRERNWLSLRLNLV